MDSRGSVREDRTPDQGPRLLLIAALLLLSAGGAAAAARDGDRIRETEPGDRAPLMRGGDEVRERFGPHHWRQRALETVRSHPEVAAYLEDHPGTETEIRFLERYHVWIVEFIDEGRERGMASADPRGGRVLELVLSGRSIPVREGDEGPRERREDPDDRPEHDEGDDREPGLLATLVPVLEGPHLLLVFAVLLCLVALHFSKAAPLHLLDVLSLGMLFPFQMFVWRSTAAAYAGIYAVTVYFLLRLVAGALMGPGSPEDVSAGGPAARRSSVWPLAAALGVFVFCHVRTLSAKEVDDAGIWSMIGGRHLLATGKLPYGRFEGDGDTYGPLMYLLHAPAAALWPPTGLIEGKRAPLEPDSFARGMDYRTIDATSTKMVVGLFDLAALALLILIGRRMRSWTAGLGCALVYAASPYVIGSGTGGLAWASHVVPVTFTLLSFALAHRPAAAGASLGLGAAALYYPAFAFPLWLGYYLPDRKRAARFAAGFVCVGLLAAVTVLGLTRPTLARYEDKSALSVFLDRTWGVQEGSGEGSYGRSRFGLWGQFPRIAFLKRPVSVAYLLLCLMLCRWPRPRTRYALACLTGAVFLGTQLWKTHGGGTYVAWYFPFLVLAVVLLSRRGKRPAPCGP